MDRYNGMRRAGDWLGKRVRLKRTVTTRAQNAPAGFEGVVVAVHNGLDIEGPRCPNCGVSFFVRKVGYFLVELVEPGPE